MNEYRGTAELILRGVARRLIIPAADLTNRSACYHLSKSRIRSQEPELQHIIHVIQPYIHHYGYLAVFVAIFLEDFGVPLPGETMLIAASLMAPPAP